MKKIKRVKSKKEQRLDARASVKCAVRFRLIHTGDHEKTKKFYWNVYEAKSLDLGEGGIALLTKKSVKKEQYVELDLCLKSKERPIKALTRVTYSGKIKKNGEDFYKVGLRFLAIGDENARKIVSFLK